jgi:hypothetical protein
MVPLSWAQRYTWIGLFALVLALAGCATRDSGYKITDETIAFIQPGMTTRSDVVENLGTPLLELRDPHVIAYSWGKMRASAAKPAIRDPAITERNMSYGVTPQAFEDGGLVEMRRWICCVALDEKDRVTRFGKVKIEPASSLEQAVRAWASGLAPAPN